jgi:hypothetical protein
MAVLPPPAALFLRVMALLLRVTALFLRAMALFPRVMALLPRVTALLLRAMAVSARAMALPRRAALHRPAAAGSLPAAGQGPFPRQWAARRREPQLQRAEHRERRWRVAHSQASKQPRARQPFARTLLS